MFFFPKKGSWIVFLIFSVVFFSWKENGSYFEKKKKIMFFFEVAGSFKRFF